MSIVYLNGEFMPQEEALISPTDRGFLFGDGIYEAIPFYRGNPFALKPHLARLQSGLTFLRIKNFTEEWEDDKLLEIFRTLLVKNKLDSAKRTMIYLQITRGATPNRSHGFPTDPISTTVYAFCREINFPSPDRWLKGYTAALIQDERWGRVDIKTINLLPNVLAFQDAKEKGADEAILYKDGIALEGSHTNLFVVLLQQGDEGGESPTTKRKTLVTHPTTNQILPGVTRAVVLNIARKQVDDIVVEERPILLEELHQAQEVFLTSTTSEIKPVVTIDGKAVQDGTTVGETTRRLWHLFAERVEKETGVTLCE